jgi:hypothetical protein
MNVSIFFFNFLYVCDVVMQISRGNMFLAPYFSASEKLLPATQCIFVHLKMLQPAPRLKRKK